MNPRAVGLAGGGQLQLHWQQHEDHRPCSVATRKQKQLAQQAVIRLFVAASALCTCMYVIGLLERMLTFFRAAFLKSRVRLAIHITAAVER